MMKAPKAIAVAVRRPNHTIVVQHKAFHSPAEKHSWMGWPFIRGAVSLFTMLSMGMNTLQQSTDMLGILDDEPTKFERWLSKKLGKGIDKIVMATAIVLAVVLSIGLFFVLPELFAKLLKGIWPDGGMSWLINLLSGVLAYRHFSRLHFLLRTGCRTYAERLNITARSIKRCIVMSTICR